MTTDNTGEYPLRTLDEMRAAREKGDEILRDGQPITLHQAVVPISFDDLNMLGTSLAVMTFTARPRKPKEFDFWEAGRRVMAQEAKSAHSDKFGAIIRGVSGCLEQRKILDHYTFAVTDEAINAKWTLIGNDGKPVYE